jgi:NAD(P)-dependent dehydrogenase (short-subunit alcohol dehydrogenase family)
VLFILLLLLSPSNNKSKNFCLALAFTTFGTISAHSHQEPITTTPASIMAEAPKKVAIITGGANGMGMFTAEHLSARGGWSIHLLDHNAGAGAATASRIPGTTFHQIDLRDYDALGALFKKIWISEGGRLDFVHSNAGVLDQGNYYTLAPDGPNPPPKPNLFSVEVNLEASLNVCHMARHYLRQSPDKGTIVVTASCASIYPGYFSPVYTASKYGILGYVRAVAPSFAQEGIRINALCPGQVRTTLVDNWDMVPKEGFTPPELIASTVLGLLDGNDMTDNKGVTVKAADMYGQSVIANGPNVYFSYPPDYVDENMTVLMDACRPEVQLGHMIRDE